MLGTPEGAEDPQWQRDQELWQTLRSTLSREFRELGERLRQDAREDLRRFVDEHAARLQRALEQGHANPGKSRKGSMGPGSPRFAPGGQLTPSAASSVILRSHSHDSLKLSACLSLPVPEMPDLVGWDSHESGTSSIQTSGGQQTAELPVHVTERPGQDPSEAQRPHNVWMDIPKVVLSRGVKVDPRSSNARSFSKWQKSRKKKMGRQTTGKAISAKVEQKNSRDKRLAELIEQTPGKDVRPLRSVLTSLRFFLLQAASSEYFDYVMGAILLANAILIGIQADHMASNAQNSDEVPGFFKACNLIFCILFTLELSARAAVDGCSFWSCSNDGWKWNWFDTIVVFTAIVDELSQALLGGTEVQEAISSVGIIRLLRLARVARLVRMVRLIPELKSMVYLIMASLSSFIWTSFLLMMMIFCFAVYFTELATEMVTNNPYSDMTDVLRCWGSLGQSILSLFQAMTGGDDWRNFVDVFNRPESSFGFNSVVFSIYIAFTTLVMLNLVTGVFVEGAQRIMREDRHEALMKLASKVFIDADIDCSASLQKEEFDALLDGGHMDDFLRETGLKKTEAHRLFYVFDEDNSGDLSLLEFVGGCIRMNASAKSADVAELRYQQKVISEHLARRLQSVEETVLSLGDFLTGARPSSAVSSNVASSRRMSSVWCRANSPQRSARAASSQQSVRGGGAWTCEAETGNQRVPESDVDEFYWA